MSERKDGRRRRYFDLPLLLLLRVHLLPLHHLLQSLPIAMFRIMVLFYLYGLMVTSIRTVSLCLFLSFFNFNCFFSFLFAYFSLNNLFIQFSSFYLLFLFMYENAERSSLMMMMMVFIGWRPSSRRRGPNRFSIIPRKLSSSSPRGFPQ